MSETELPERITIKKEHTLTSIDGEVTLYCSPERWIIAVVVNDGSFRGWHQTSIRRFMRMLGTAEELFDQAELAEWERQIRRAITVVDNSPSAPQKTT